jgi:hypothetical protein
MMIARFSAALAVCFATVLGWASQAQVAPNAADGPAAAESARYRAELQAFQQAVWIEENGGRHALESTQHPVQLPAFKEYRYPQVLRVLHQELLVTSSNKDQNEPINCNEIVRI